MEDTLNFKEIHLYDRIYLSNYHNCKHKYLLGSEGQFLPADNLEINRSVILERSISGSGYWVVIKVGNEISDKLKNK